MKTRLLAITALGWALWATAQESGAPAPEAAPRPAPAPSIVSKDGKIVVEVEENGKLVTRVIDLNDPASAATIQGKALITTEINGKCETRIVDLKDADKLLSPFLFNERPLVRTGPVTFLGVAAMELPRDVSAQLPLPAETGLLIGGIAPDSPAAKAGLMESDVLCKLDDQILITQRQLAVLIANHKEGDTVKLTYFRKGQQMEASAALGKREAPAPMENTAPFPSVTRRILKFGLEGADTSVSGSLDQLPPELRPLVEKALEEARERAKATQKSLTNPQPSAVAPPANKP